MSLSRVESIFDKSIAVKENAVKVLGDGIVNAGHVMAQSIKNGGKIMVCGNGGSASDSQHFASELINRFERERPALPAIALTADSSNITSIANDYDYEFVFSRQINALAKAEDVLLVISTSGESKNVVNAINSAHANNISVVALTGKSGGEIACLITDSDIELRVPSVDTARIQETHITIIHALCDLIDFYLYDT